MRGYYTNTGKKQYVLLTEKKQITVKTIAVFLRKIAEVQNVPAEKCEAILHDRASCAEMRKRIEPCSYEVMTGAAGKYHHIEVGKKPYSFINCPIDNADTIIFSETAENPLTGIYE